MNPTAPWTATMSPTEYSLVFYFLVIAGLALFAQSLHTWTSRGEVGARYRPAVLTGLCITAVAFLSYVVLVLKLDSGYDMVDGMWVPNAEAIWSWAPRYMDWTVTVPLLMVELIAVSSLVGARARRMRTAGIVAAAGMIFTGYLGGVAVDGGESRTGLWVWGVISTAFFLVLYWVLFATLRTSLAQLSREVAPTYRNAAVLLAVMWLVYPVVYAFQIYAGGGGWTMTMQLLLSLADVAAKVGFGVLIHKVAKLRTAEDVAAGVDVHPESIWVSSMAKAPAVAPAHEGRTAMADGSGHHTAQHRQ